MARDRPACCIANRRTIARLSDIKLMNIYEVEFSAVMKVATQDEHQAAMIARDAIYKESRADLYLIGRSQIREGVGKERSDC